MDLVDFSDAPFDQICRLQTNPLSWSFASSFVSHLEKHIIARIDHRNYLFVCFRFFIVCCSLEPIIKVHVKVGTSSRFVVILEVSELHWGT